MPHLPFRRGLESRMIYPWLDSSSGCSATRQIANVLDTWTCPATSTGDSCAVEYAAGYEWLASGGVACLTTDIFVVFMS